MRAYPHLTLRFVRASLLSVVATASLIAAVAVARAEEPKKPGAVIVLSRADGTQPAKVDGTPADPQPDPRADPWAWLEEIDGERALAWVRAHNAATAKKLETQPIYQELHANA